MQAQAATGILVSNDTLAVVSLLVGLASLAASAISLWLSLHFKSEADTANAATTTLLSDIRSEVTVITQFYAAEVSKQAQWNRDMLGASIVTPTIKSEAANEPPHVPANAPVASDTKGTGNAEVR